MKSTIWWYLQVGETGKISGWKWNLQACKICKWVKQTNQVGENEIYKLVISASGWNGKNKWVKGQLGKRKWVKMSNFTLLQPKWYKFTHIFVTSTNSPSTHPVFTHPDEVFGESGEFWRRSIGIEGLVSNLPHPQINKTKQHTHWPVGSCSLA